MMKLLLPDLTFNNKALGYHPFVAFVALLESIFKCTTSHIVPTISLKRKNTYYSCDIGSLHVQLPKAIFIGEILKHYSSQVLQVLSQFRYSIYLRNFAQHTVMLERIVNSTKLCAQPQAYSLSFHQIAILNSSGDPLSKLSLFILSRPLQLTFMLEYCSSSFLILFKGPFGFPHGIPEDQQGKQSLHPSSATPAAKPCTNTFPRITKHGFPPNIKGITIFQLAPASQWAGGTA
ncbi:hypothetical protein ACMG4M_05170 [Alcanivorax sp. IL3]|uniref:hypothetical protein n=1 Tax=unclassified Alcanivorax TaxID=2638842 RepID=UPI0039C19CE2